MSETIVKIAQYLPTVREPEKEQSLKEMLTWTGIVLLLYFLLSSIPVYTFDNPVASGALGQLQQFQTLVGASIGTILTLGITPIVTASIVLQMMVGSEILPWDTNTDEGQLKFQSAQKVLAYGLTIFMALGYVLSGTFGNLLAESVNNSYFVISLITGQIALGGVLIILLDDLVKQWGFGQGVSLFIAAGVSKQIIIGFISPLTQTQNLFWNVDGNPAGALLNFAVNLEASALLPVIATIAVFAVAVYLQSMRVEIPLTFGNVRGFGQKWPLKFLYTSVMPIIFVGALVANVQIVGSALGDSILGTFSNGQAQSGFASYLNAPTKVITGLVQDGFATVGPSDIFHIFFYLGVYITGSTVFSIFWARTSGQDSQSVAEQISETGMKVPGFRKDSRVIKKVLDRYIPGLTVLSGATMGLLAASANMTQAAGGGTGILLTVMIIYRMYEQLAQKQLEEIHPALGDFFQS